MKYSDIASALLRTQCSAQSMPAWQFTTLSLCACYPDRSGRYLIGSANLKVDVPVQAGQCRRPVICDLQAAICRKRSIRNSSNDGAEPGRRMRAVRHRVANVRARGMQCAWQY